MSNLVIGLICIGVWAVVAVLVHFIIEAVSKFLKNIADEKQRKYIDITVEDIIVKVEYDKSINESKIMMNRLINEPYVINFFISKQNLDPYMGNRKCTFDIIDEISIMLRLRGYNSYWDFRGFERYKIFVVV